LDLIEILDEHSRLDTPEMKRLRSIKINTSLDYFGGVLAGLFPSYSPYTYRSIVDSLKI